MSNTILFRFIQILKKICHSGLTTIITHYHHYYCIIIIITIIIIMPKEVDYTNHWEEEGMVVSETVTSLIALEILPYHWNGKKFKR